MKWNLGLGWPYHKYYKVKMNYLRTIILNECVYVYVYVCVQLYAYHYHLWTFLQYKTPLDEEHEDGYCRLRASCRKSCSLSCKQLVEEKYRCKAQALLILLYNSITKKNL